MRRLGVLFAVTIVLGFGVACGDDGDDARATTTTVDPELRAFATDADAVCASLVPRFGELRDPDGDGGLKPLGTGQLMQEGFTELGKVRPPEEYAATWDQAIKLLVDAGRKLAESEQLAAAGDTAASDRAQSDALFRLEPEAGALIAQIDAPFEVCFE